MSAETASPSAAPQLLPEDDERHDRLIQQRIDRTRMHVKVVGLATAGTELAAGVLAFLLGVMLLDHWVIGLTPTLRLVALIVLLVGAAAFAIWRLVPCLTRPVNPMYAARAIEQAVPSLKNSLINFLMLRSQRQTLRPLIYAGVQRQAADDLQTVDVDSAVDRSELIRVGSVLAALVVLIGIYKFASPKDPFQSAARVIMPWKSLPRPARVQIGQVQPGSAEVYRGDDLEVTALVDGLQDDEPVLLYYSTDDGQAVDRQLTLQAAAGDPRFRVRLTTGEYGIQAPLSYHLQAGDARTDDFRVLLKEAPHIVLQSVEYRYPRYTGWPNDKVTGQGDLKALEGTQVTLAAVANQPIRSVHLELFTPDDLAADATAERPGQAYPLKFDGQRAWGQFTLALQADRRTPQYAAYRIRFTNREGQRNSDPARYRIEVTPDLAPLVEIVAPRRREVDLPADGSLPIEVRALDPDFLLQRLTLQAAVGDREMLNRSLIDEPQQGQVVQKYEFSPARLRLSAGDLVVYHAVAHDNRAATGSDSPDPNQTKTDEYRIRIVEAQQPPADAQTQEGADGNQPSDEGSSAGEPQAGEDGQQGADGQAADGQQATEGAGESSDGQGAGETGGQEANEAGSREGDRGATDDGAGAGESVPPDGAQGEPQSNDGSSGASGADGTAAPDAAAPSQSDGAETGSRSPAASGEAAPGEGGEPSIDSPADAPGQPVASDGSNDSDAIERILEHLKDQSNKSSPKNDKSATPDTPAADAASATPSSDESTPPETPADPAREQPTTAVGNPAERPSDPNGGPQDGQPTGAGGSDPPQEPKPRAGQQAQRDATSARGAGDPKSSEAAGQPPPQTADSPSEPPPAGQGTPARDSAQQGGGANQQPNAADPANSQQPNDTDAAPQDPSRQPPQVSPQPAQGSGPTGAGKPPQAGEPRQPSDQQSTSAAPSEAGSADGTAGGDAPTDNAMRPGTTADGSPADTPSVPGGQPADGQAEATVQGDEQSVEDRANLQFARQATDLALEHLRDQTDNAELLERLGWTPEQAAAFLRRWQQMQQAAKQGGPQGDPARRRLEDQLRGLGLRPSEASLRRDVTRSDGSRGLIEGGQRPAPPAEYRDQYRAFLRSVAPSENE